MANIISQGQHINTNPIIPKHIKANIAPKNNKPNARAKPNIHSNASPKPFSILVIILMILHNA